MAESMFLDCIRKFGGANQKETLLFHNISKQLDEEHIEIANIDINSGKSRSDGYTGMKIILKNGPTFVFLPRNECIQIGHISPDILVTRYRKPIFVPDIMKNLKEIIPISPIGDVDWPQLSSDDEMGFDLFG